MPRNPGECTSPGERAKWSFKKLIDENEKFIRMDCGGKNPIDYVVDKLQEDGFCVPRRMAHKIVEIIKKQLQGSRDRCSHNFDEMRRRILG